MSRLAQFLIGLLFGTGLLVAGMSNPAKVLSFLDVAAIPAGLWDASLAFVMAGGVLVAAVGYKFVWKMQAPVFGTTFHLPTARSIDLNLVFGSALFGTGWGLVGFCPGPAIAALGTGEWQAFVFSAAMFTGMAAARMFTARMTSVSAAE
jgi:uncharacterized protein